MNLRLLTGLGLLAILVIAALLGAVFIDLDDARPLSAAIAHPPSWDTPLGTDSAGREIGRAQRLNSSHG